MPIVQAVKEDSAPLPGEAPASARVGLGHNRPPLEEIIPAEFRAALLRDRPDFLVKLGQLVEAADRAFANDDESLGRCGDLVGDYRKCLSHVNATHKEVKEPHLLAGRLVDAEKNALVDMIETAKRAVEAKGNAYVAERDAKLKAERDRIAAEEREAAMKAAAAEQARINAEREAEAAARAASNDAEREAAAARAEQARREAEEAMQNAALAAAQATSKAEPVRSDAGSTVSGKQEWLCEVEDYAKAFRAVSDDPKVREAIDAAVKRLVRAGKREIKGCRVWPVAKANFR